MTRGLGGGREGFGGVGEAWQTAGLNALTTEGSAGKRQAAALRLMTRGLGGGREGFGGVGGF